MDYGDKKLWMWKSKRNVGAIRRGLANKNRPCFGKAELCLLSVRCLGKSERAEIGFLLKSMLVFTLKQEIFLSIFFRLNVTALSLSFRHACGYDGDVKPGETQIRRMLSKLLI